MEFLIAYSGIHIFTSARDSIRSSIRKLRFPNCDGNLFRAREHGKYFHRGIGERSDAARLLKILRDFSSAIGFLELFPSRTLARRSLWETIRDAHVATDELTWRGFDPSKPPTRKKNGMSILKFPNFRIEVDGRVKA